MNNVMLVHGYNGVPKIFTYFKEKLEEKGYNVSILEFPIRTDITIKAYFEVFDKYKEYFNDNLIVVAHSIGNGMLLKYISKYHLNIGLYIGLAGFAEPFVVDGRDDFNKVMAQIVINPEEKENFISLVKNRYSIYSNNDHLVPFSVLENFPRVINAKGLLIEGIGHMGKKSGLEELPEVIEIIEKI